MPVFEQGYRRYEGEFRPQAVRWLPIARTCFKASFNRMSAIVLVGAAIPLFISMFRAYSSGLTGGAALGGGVSSPYGYGDGLFFELLGWETFWAVLLLAVSCGGLIAEDLRTGALQIYFSRPITNADYVIGKLMATVFTTSLVTLVPGLVLLLAAMAFAPDFTFLTDNPLLPLKIIAFSLLVSFVLGPMVLALSSLGRKGKMVGILFAGIYFFSRMLAHVLPKIFGDSRWEAVDFDNCLISIGRTIFTSGPGSDAPSGLSWGILASLTFLSLLVLSRRADSVEVVS